MAASTSNWGPSTRSRPGSGGTIPSRMTHGGRASWPRYLPKRRLSEPVVSCETPGGPSRDYVSTIHDGLSRQKTCCSLPERGRGTRQLARTESLANCCCRCSRTLCGTTASSTCSTISFARGKSQYQPRPMGDPQECWEEPVVEVTNKCNWLSRFSLRG